MFIIYKLLENVLMGKCYKSVLLLETLICVIKNGVATFY